MSEPANPDTTPGGKMVFTMGLVATICGVLIVGAFESTRDAIAANKRIKLEQAVFKVLPGATKVTEYVATTGGIQPAGKDAPQGGVTLYAAYDQAGALKGIAAEAASTGYADTVRLLYGYDVKCQCIIGISVVSMRETPGIGDRILTDKAFLKNFEALDVRVNPEMTALANAVKTVKHGSKTNPWQIDAIAGATITSKAVGRGINESAQRLMPLLVPHVNELTAEEAKRNDGKKEHVSQVGEGGRGKGDAHPAPLARPSLSGGLPFSLPSSPFPNEGVQA